MSGKTEVRTFRMDPAMLLDVIHRQAGSLSKAIGEGLQNATDAGATRCDITLDSDCFTITDDGRGFGGRQEIESFFETFGKPHVEGDGATYGKFRMGRGQMMSFAATVWRSSTFQMETDVKTRGLDYTLVDELAPASGCRIEGRLYHRLSPIEIHNTERDLETFAAYMLTPVYLNGRRISRDPASEKWDVVTADAYIRRKATGGVRIYNFGVHVCDESSYQHGGVDALVVSRKVLQLNFPRNAVMSAICPVWKRIAKEIGAFAERNTAKRSASLTSDQRCAKLVQLLTGQRPLDAVLDTPMLRKVPTGWYSVQSLLNRLVQQPNPVIAFAQSAELQQAEAVAQAGVAVVLGPEVLEWSRAADGAAFLTDLRRLIEADESLHRWKRDRWLEALRHASVGEVATLSKGLCGQHIVLPPNSLSPAETMLCLAAQKAVSILAAAAGCDERTVRLGQSYTAAAWTDGMSYIVVERALARRALASLAGMVELVNVLAHEICHEHPDGDSHAHDEAFYERYHELTSCGEAPSGRALQSYLQVFLTSAKLRKVKINRALSTSLGSLWALSSLPQESSEVPAAAPAPGEAVAA